MIAETIQPYSFRASIAVADTYAFEANTSLKIYFEDESDETFNVTVVYITGNEPDVYTKEDNAVSITSGNSNTVNIYDNSGTLTIQNNTASLKSFLITRIK